MSVVDSCGWLEHFANGCNAEFLAPILEATDPLIVPSRIAALNAAPTFLLVGRRTSWPFSPVGGARGSSVRRVRSWASGSWAEDLAGRGWAVRATPRRLDGNTLRIDSVVMRKAANPSPRAEVLPREGFAPVGGWFHNSGINQGYRCRCSAAFSIRNGVAEAGAKEGGFGGEDQVAVPLGDRSSVWLGE